MAHIKFKDYLNEDWTAHVHGNKDGTSYTVKKLGKKIAAHGGLKVGEKINDTHLDDLKDSKVKVKIKPYMKEAIQRRMDRKTIIATDPATGRKVVKIAPKKEVEIGKGKMESFDPFAEDIEFNKLEVEDIDITNQEEDNNDFVTRMADNVVSKMFNRDVNINELRTSTIASYQKKAGKQYGELKKSKSRMDQDKAQGLADAGKATQSQADSMGKKQADYKKRGEGLARSKRALGKKYSDKEVRMGKGVAFDKRYKGGNMTGAYKAINKIKKGLADHPKVSRALRTANEDFKGKES